MIQPAKWQFQASARHGEPLIAFMQLGRPAVRDDAAGIDMVAL